jgi:hypothetical protein
MKNHNTTIISGGLLVMALATSAQAVTVSTVGSFNDPASTSYMYSRIYNQDNTVTPSQHLPGNLNSSTDSVAYFGWGIDVWESVITGQKIQSHFWFNGVGSVAGGAAASVPYGTAFSLGTFTYTNEQTVLSGGLVNIDFRMDIKVDGLGLVPVEYQLQIDNTPNIETANSYDIARIVAAPNNISFFQNGSEYLLTFDGFSRDGGATFETVAYLAEDQQTSAQIYATITQVVVPVPAAIWLMGSGLLALFGFARVKK